MTKKEKQLLEQCEVAIYVLAITCARDGSIEEKTEALTMIRDLESKAILLRDNKANPNFVILSTVGMSAGDGIELARQVMEVK